MGDDEKSSAGMVMDALKKRLASAFPKLVGNKLDKALYSKKMQR